MTLKDNTRMPLIRLSRWLLRLSERMLQSVDDPALKSEYVRLQQNLKAMTKPKLVKG